MVTMISAVTTQLGGQKAIWGFQLTAATAWIATLTQVVQGTAIFITAITGMLTAGIALWLAIRKARAELKGSK